MYTEKEFEEHVEITTRVLKDTYVNNIIYVQERIKDGAEEAEIKNIEELIIANERMIVYFDQSDEWVKQLHEEAQRKSGESNDGEPIEGELISGGDDEEAVARSEEARNS